MTDLVQRSIDVIREHQAESGAYVASPNFSTYHYSWFRDGAYIAYAMDVVGEHQSSHRFHGWVADTLLQHADTAERAIEKAHAGEPLGDDYLDTRYRLDGESGDEEWPNFQLDGLGTWLWALAEHLERTDVGLPATWRAAMDLTTRYLDALWGYPCYDLWEEFPDYVHPYTLATIYGGFEAVATLLPTRRDALEKTTDEIKRFVLEHAVFDGCLVKSIAAPASSERCPLTGMVDASLIGLAIPYGLLSADDPCMQATIVRIEKDLCRPGGGVYRYPEDTYYGGGEWVLLAAWLGWYHAEAGDGDRARDLLTWIESQVDENGDLPEQVSSNVLSESHYPMWVERWGTIAKPLLWSHAMYLILRANLS